MTKIKLDFEQIKELAALSISNGTEKAFIPLVLQWAEEANKYIHSNNIYGSCQEVPCKDHPDAPHGFDRNGSHSQGRYVCECESWSPECTVALEMLERALKFVMRSPWSEERAELANDLKKALTSHD